MPHWRTMAGFVLCGQSGWIQSGPFSPSPCHAHITEINVQGDVEWSVLYVGYGPPPSVVPQAQSVVATSDGAYAATGTRLGWGWLEKTGEQPKQIPIPSLNPSPSASQTLTPEPSRTPTLTATPSSSPTTISLQTSQSTESPATDLPSPSRASLPTSLLTFLSIRSTLPMELIYASTGAIAAAAIVAAGIYLKKRIK